MGAARASAPFATAAKTGFVMSETTKPRRRAGVPVPVLRAQAGVQPVIEGLRTRPSPARAGGGALAADGWWLRGRGEL